MILVTGGTGLVGAHLLAFLAKEETAIKAIYRSKEKLAAVKVVFGYYFEDVDAAFSKISWHQADITDVPSLEMVFPEVTHVYHCAALISFDPKDFKSLRKINVEGTANMVNLCLSYNIQKLCYVSSIATLGENTDPTLPITEETHWNAEADNSVYAITKYGAEMEVWRGIQEGLNAVIVNPGVILGSGFWYSGSGALFYKIRKGLKYYTTGNLAYVDVVDVVTLMIQLMQSNIKSERFVLVTENWNLKDFMTTTATHLDVKPPTKQVSNFMLNVAWRMDWWRQFFTGKKRRLTKNTAKSLQTVSIHDSTKVKKALNFEFIPVEETIKRVCSRFH